MDSDDKTNARRQMVQRVTQVIGECTLGNNMNTIKPNPDPISKKMIFGWVQGDIEILGERSIVGGGEKMIISTGGELNARASKSFPNQNKTQTIHMIETGVLEFYGKGEV